MASKLYYDPVQPPAFATLKMLQVASKKIPADIKAWLEKQHAYSLHRKNAKRFPRYLYSVNNTNDLLEWDLVDVQSVSKYNDGVKYLLTVIDVFSKFLHIKPLLSKTGKAVANAFKTIFNYLKYSRSVRRYPSWCAKTGERIHE
jgi:hypothetical protein